MQRTNPSSFLRTSLLSNAAFSMVSGVCFIAAATQLASLIGLGNPAILRVIGASLLVFAVGLFANAMRKSVSVKEAWIAVALDVGWVAGSVVVILAGVLTTTGNWAVAIIADAVFLFALLQFLGLRKMPRPDVGR